MSYPNGPSPEDPYGQQGQGPSGGHPAPDQSGGHPTPPPGPGDPQQGYQQPGGQPYDPSGHQSGGYPPPQQGGYVPHPGYGPQPSSATTGQPNQDERTMALLTHLSGIVLGFIGPLIFFLIKKDESPFVRDQAAQALNFQILVAIGYVVSVILYIIIIGAFLQMIIWVGALVFAILAGVAANRGEWYRYPFNVSWVK